ncbi:MAG: hypothetical protein FWF53_06890 [Candidatus Azobacteroides sp.]|nr:hypothetical protein [Candidatus Azobacteroides sp.]
METKYPIVQFSDDRQDGCCCYVLPVSEGGDAAFFSPATSGVWFVSNLNGDKIGSEYIVPSDGFIDLSSVDLSAVLAPGDCFRIAAGNYFSNPFQYIGCNTDNTHVFEYRDGEDDRRQRIRISCVIENSQSKTDKSEYIDSNGLNISLSKTRRKEYDLTTDFYPESVHDAIKEIFIYPNLSVDDTLMFESGDYETEWDEKDENDNARATTKLSEQDINRYSIC